MIGFSRCYSFWRAPFSGNISRRPRMIRHSLILHAPRPSGAVRASARPSGCGSSPRSSGRCNGEMVGANSGRVREFAILGDLLWSIGPHLHFADFTSRLTFFWGPLPLTPFLNASMYFGGILLFGSLVALRLWKYRNA